MNKKLTDAVFGFAVGDALGVPHEFKTRGSFRCTGMTGGGTWGQAVGTWSDDTSLVLATCASIKEHKKLVPVDIMRRFENWLTDGEYSCRGEVFDVGNTTLTAIDRFRNGVGIEDCGESHNLACGNGSLMRILPLAFIPKDKENFLRVAALTHRNKLCIDACAIYVDLLKKIIDGEDLKEVLIPKRCANLSRNFSRLPEIWLLKKSGIRNSGYVVDTLEAAIWCFTTSSNYREAVLKAVNLGGDTDTIAALTGGLAGLKWGLNSIPVPWFEKLANKSLIYSCLF